MHRVAILSLLIFGLFIAGRADVAPDPGYVQHKASLILETDSDLSAYRFFIESPIEVEEIKIEKGRQTVIDAGSRGGGAGKFGKIVAVPATSLTAYGPEMSPEQLQQLKTALSAKKVPGSVDLLSHSFLPIVRESEVAGYRDPVYKVLFDDLGIKATLAAGGRPSNAGDIDQSSTAMRIATIVGGIFIVLAAIVIFFLITRRSAKTA
jgi:hypothetical protein